jgi:hypothetical protein
LFLVKQSVIRGKPPIAFIDLSTLKPLRKCENFGFCLIKRTGHLNPEANYGKNLNFISEASKQRKFRKSFRDNILRRRISGAFTGSTKKFALVRAKNEHSWPDCVL